MSKILHSSFPDKWGQYHLRQRVGPLVNPRIESLTRPLTQVVLMTSCLQVRLDAGLYRWIIRRESRKADPRRGEHQANDRLRIFNLAIGNPL